jgi:hypothetical protein
MNKWKIDIYDSAHSPFGLYRMTAQESMWRDARWDCIERFPTREEAKVFWEKIKDLPEYLS